MAGTDEDSLEQQEEVAFSIADLDKIGWKKIVIIALVVMFFLGFMAGQQYGYRQGYSYVRGWYEKFVEISCQCYNETTQKNPKFVSNLSFVFEK